MYKRQKYFSLSPLSDIDNGEVYFEALEEKLNDDSIRNIAITGTFGSGKSSVLESYIAKSVSYTHLTLPTSDLV